MAVQVIRFQQPNGLASPGDQWGVVFGKTASAMLGGTVQLCIEPGQKDDTFQKTPTRRVRLAGTFEVDVSELKTP